MDEETQLTLPGNDGFEPAETEDGYADSDDADYDDAEGDDSAEELSAIADTDTGEQEAIAPASPALSESEEAEITSLSPAFGEEDLSALAEEFGVAPQAVARMAALMGRLAAHHVSAESLANTHLQTEMRAAPDYISANLPAIQKQLATIPPALRANRKAVLMAVFAVEVERARPGDTVGDIAQRVAGKTTRKAPERPAAPSLPKAAAVPTPSGAAGRGSGVQTRRPSASVGADYLTRRFGLDDVESRDLASVARGRR